MNVIPAIDLRDGRCVRLYKGDFERETIYENDAVNLAKDYAAMGCQYLHVVDLDGAQSGRQENGGLIRRIVGESDLSVQLGGGIRTEAVLESWLQLGVSRVVIGSLAVTKPRRVKRWIKTFGAEKIVLALDVRLDDGGTPLLATHGWTQSSDLDLWQCVADYRTVGLQHVLCTDISRDGALSGPNIKLYEEFVRRFPDISLQASGGIRSIDDLTVLRSIGARGAISGKALLDGKITAAEVALFLPAE